MDDLEDFLIEVKCDECGLKTSEAAPFAIYYKPKSFSYVCSKCHCKTEQKIDHCQYHAAELFG